MRWGKYMAWYSYRKNQKLHLIETFNKRTKKSTTKEITYDEAFPSNIIYLDKKIKKYRIIPLSSDVVEYLIDKSFNEVQKFFIEYCFKLNLITKEEFEYNKNLLLVDDL
jgi:hypothetical protein